MLRALLFDFTGRMGRLPFLAALASIAMAAAFAHGVVLLLWPMLTKHPVSWIGGGAAWTAGAGVLAWAASAQVVKRLRDAGLPPAACCAAYLALFSFDGRWLSVMAPGRAPWPLSGVTPLTGTLFAAGCIILFLAPSRPAAGARENAPSVGGEGVPEALPA